MKELSKEEILEAFKRLASSPRYRLSELYIFTMAVRWMEEQNKGEESMKEITEITDYPMNMKDLVTHTNTNSLSLFDLKPNYNVVFHNGDHQIGRLDFNSGVMVFEGDAEESAQLFFNALAKYFADRLKEEREKEREACAQACEGLVPTVLINGERWLKDKNGNPDVRLKDLAPELESRWEAEQILKNGSAIENYTVQHRCAAAIRARGKE